MPGKSNGHELLDFGPSCKNARHRLANLYIEKTGDGLRTLKKSGFVIKQLILVIIQDLNCLIKSQN